MIVKDTESSTRQNAWFAIEDIAARAESAYDQNQQFFDDPAHQDRVTQVRKTVAQFLSSYSRIYETCRTSTRKRPANTEIKFAGIVFDRRRNTNTLQQQLVALGCKPEYIIYKPATDSISIHVT